MTKEELGELIITSKDSLYRIAKSILKADADCEDAVSEMIVEAFAKLDMLREDQFAKTWIVRILINECYHIQKKRKRETPYDEAIKSEHIASEVYSDLYRSVMQLDTEHRVTIVLYYIEGYSINEIAQIMKTTVGTVKSRLSRGSVKLRKIYQGEEIIVEKSELAK